MTTKIIEVVGDGKVLVDYSHGVVRGWCENPRDGRTLRAIRRFFPAVEIYGNRFLRLGGFRTFAGSDSLVASLADAKMCSASPFIQSLHLFEASEGEGMRTIIEAGKLT